MQFLRELMDYNTITQARCRAQRWFGALIHVSVQADIISDAIALEKQHAQTAYAAEVENTEADRIIEEILADGILTPDELPKLRQAQRFIRSSAARNRAISEAMA